MTGLRPRAEQVAALASLMRAFAVHDRVQLVMACIAAELHTLADHLMALQQAIGEKGTP
mgnify:CR=1 FL=1